MATPTKRAALQAASLLLATTGAAGLACTGSAEAEGGAMQADVRRRPNQVQMNDVSVLYPLPKSGGDLAEMLAASSVGVGGPLLPAGLYTEVTGEALTRPDGPLPPGRDVGLYYDELKVVAFRVDPCFANIGPIVRPEACKNQLRLVLQPIHFDAASSSSSATDGAVHAFYSLTREELVALVKAIVALRTSERRAEQLGALAVHPIVAAQGLAGSFARGLREIVLAYSGAKNFTRFTTFSPQNLATSWVFSGFDVEGSQATPMVIPTLPDETTSVTFFAGFGADLTGSFTPATTSKDDVALLANIGKARQATEAARNAAFDAALRVENPDKHSPDTIDCASCHVAGPARVLAAAIFGWSDRGNPNSFVPDARYVDPSDMKQTTPVNEETNRNFHAFSYRDAHPMVAMRVVNETAAVVAYLNDQIFQ